MSCGDTPSPSDLRELASRAARVAGALLLERAAEPARGVEAKSSRTDLASDADRDAEALIVAAIRRERPGDAILAEEGGADGAGSSESPPLEWVIDPLDGTTNFLWGIPHWCVSIAVEDHAGPVAGVVFDPSRDELFSAQRGGGTTLNARPLVCRPGPPFAEALIATGFNYLPEERRRQARVVADLLPRVRDIRRMGAAALDLAWVAAGRYDAYYETGLQPWDRAAGSLLVTEAGAVVERHERSVGPACTIAGPREMVAELRDRVL